MKIKSDVQLNKVDVRNVDNKNYVYIYLNETKVKVEDEHPYECYEYDFNEFIATDMDIEDIKMNPNKYLNYKVQPKLSFEELQIDINIDTDYRLSMLELGI